MNLLSIHLEEPQRVIQSSNLYINKNQGARASTKENRKCFKEFFFTSIYALNILYALEELSCN